MKQLPFARVRVARVAGACALVVAAVVVPVVPTGPALAASTAQRTDGIVNSTGVAKFRGSPGSGRPAALVGIAGLASGNGYWVARADGVVHNYGTAASYGSVATGSLATPVTGIAAHPGGHGYWLVTAAGRVYRFGAAHTFGQPASVGSKVVAITASPTGNGYWLALADGGVLAFGDATFKGSAFGPAGQQGGVVAMSATPTGRGYWLLARNGAVFTFGDAPSLGSAWPSFVPMAGIASTRSGAGYVILDANGRMRAYGDAGAAKRSIPRGSSIVGPQNRARFQPVTPTAADINSHVSSFTVGLDRAAVAIASSQGFHSYWTLTSPLPGSTIMAQSGSTGAVVRSVQYNLLSRGYWLNLTGTFDSQTTQAVWAFQKATGRSRTGTISASDYRALLASGRPKPRSTSGYLAELDKARQIVIIARNGHADWIFNTSTGTEQPYTYGGVTSIAHTPTGRFSIIREIDGLRIGRLGALWRPKYFTPDGVAFHGSSSIPPYPASHGCSRLSNAAINFLWSINALPIGTSVWVY